MSMEIILGVLADLDPPDYDPPDYDPPPVQIHVVDIDPPPSKSVSGSGMQWNWKWELKMTRRMFLLISRDNVQAFSLMLGERRF